MRLVSPLDFPSYSKSVRLTTGLPVTAGGKSHSGETPTTSSPRPRAKQISVAAGRSETIRIRFGPPDSPGPLKVFFNRGEGRAQGDWPAWKRQTREKRGRGRVCVRGVGPVGAVFEPLRGRRHDAALDLRLAACDTLYRLRREGDRLLGGE